MLSTKLIINNLLSGLDLDDQEASFACKSLLSTETVNEKKVALLTLLAKKNITALEYNAFLEVMLENASETDNLLTDVIDVCGTGGDGKNSFNISTCVAFLLASSGIKVAKHGNYSSSSLCGSSNVLEELGINFPKDLNFVRKSIDEINIAYLHAPLFHPALKVISPLRKNLGFRTIFNLLGPLANPFTKCKRLCGIATLEDMQLYQGVLEKKNTDFYLVHSYGGYDEISLTSKWKIQGVLKSNFSEKVYSPEDLGFSYIQDKDLSAGDSLESAKQIFTTILKGKGTKEQNNVVVANAIFGFKLFNQNMNLKDIKQLLLENLLSGNAYKTFNNLAEFNRC